ncbi:MAG: hypothetical protein ACLUOF_10095 [Ruminococcus sp.]
MNEENLEHALRIISTRRNSARTQQEERIQEIETRIPEVVGDQPPASAPAGTCWKSSGTAAM